VDTAQVAELISGDKLYQQRARKAFPNLVRQAFANQPIYYSDLADELGMQNPRNLNYVLGSIGTTLERLSEEWNEKVPPINCLVVNKATDLPGEGIEGFIGDRKAFATLPRKQKRALVDAELRRIYAYSKWHSVLDILGLI